ncbi:MAG: HDOD domain-containing protein [Deferrisomatales bacterium]
MNVKEVLARIDKLPPMPAVAVKLLEVTQDPDVSLAAVATLLERDPSMAANLLRVCNSPLYGLRAQVTSVRQAVSLLGLRKVIQVAMTALSSGYLSPAQQGYALAAGELWRSSLSAAIAAELLAREVGYPRPSTAYTAGLLQDVGKIVLADAVASYLPDIARQIEAHRIGWDEAERRVVGMPHSEVGALLLERWGFPDLLVESVRTHHAPSQATIDPDLARISHLADALTMTVGMGLGADGLTYTLDPTALEALGIDDRSRVEGLVAELIEQLGRAEDLLGAAAARAT